MEHYCLQYTGNDSGSAGTTIKKSINYHYEMIKGEACLIKSKKEKKWHNEHLLSLRKAL